MDHISQIFQLSRRIGTQHLTPRSMAHEKSQQYQSAAGILLDVQSDIRLATPVTSYKTLFKSLAWSSTNYLLLQHYKTFCLVLSSNGKGKN